MILKHYQSNSRSLVLGSLAALAILSAGLEVTQAAEEAPTKTVSFSDLDLSHMSGAKALFRRLKLAAEEVCTPLESADHIRAMEYKACVANAESNAVQHINKPLLTQYFESIEGKPAARPGLLANAK
jgi:UrcA family protein